MKTRHQSTLVAGAALLAFLFLFLMTATKGKYLGSSEMDEYIIIITEGEHNSYLSSKTPTAMMINKLEGSSAFLKRECLKRGTCYSQKSCTAADEGYIISKGQKIAKASLVRCS